MAEGTVIPPQSYARPANEAERLAELRRYSILDSEPVEAYDRYVKIAQQLFDVPIAMIAMMEEDRQWIKSIIGADVESVSREMTFCTHSILASEPLYVPDTHADDRFRQSPFVTGPPYARFYAGAPLVTANGCALGTICIISTKPRLNFGPSCMSLLQELAAGVMNKLELRLEIARRREAEEDQRKAILRLENSKQELEQFSYSASHDLQEPLRTVARQCLLARTYSDAGQIEDVQEALSVAWAATVRMQNLVDGFVSFLTLGRVDLLVEPVDLNEMVNKLLKGDVANVGGRKGKVVASKLPTVRVDRDYFQRLFENIINNALKFNRCDEPTVWISAEKQDDETVILFCDNGVGVPEEIAHCIFDVFQRGHSSQEFPGSGIGLASAKRIIERHGGEIWLEEHDRPGTTIAISLPPEAVMED